MALDTLDSLGALKVFARAAETRSFTEAGNQLALSPSAVGKAVARLEQRLAVRLFHRSTRSITLTEEGQQLLESCRRIFAEVETIASGLAQAQGAPRGRLRVSLPVIGVLMMPTLSAFMTRYPEWASTSTSPTTSSTSSTTATTWWCAPARPPTRG